MTSEGGIHSLDLAPVSHVLLSVIVLDLVGYGIHRFYIAPLFWRFHRAYTSDSTWTTTSIRFHLGEVIITTGMKGFGVWALGVSPAGSSPKPHAMRRLVRACQREIAEQAGHDCLAIVTPTMHWIHHSRRRPSTM